MAKSKKKSQGKSKAKSKGNRGNGGGGGGGGGGGAARRTSKSGQPSRARSARSKTRSSQARTLEGRIRLALAGEAKGWGASGPEQDTKMYFQYQGGMNEIRQSNSQKLLAAIASMKPNSGMKRDMIAAANERLREIESQSNNSYSMPNLNSP
jgi:hypothetical protein